MQADVESTFVRRDCALGKCANRNLTTIRSILARADVPALLLGLEILFDRRQFHFLNVVYEK